MNKKKYLAIIMATVLGLTTFAACRKSNTDVAADDAEQDVVEDGDEGVNPPFLTDLEMYDSVISNLSADQYYAFAGVAEDYDVLLVTDGVYDYDGTTAAIDATIYGLDADGKVIEIGSVESDGTAYPLSVYEDYLMFGGNHHMAMVFVDNGNMVTKKDADEVFDEEGNVTYYLFDYDNHFEGEVEDDSELVSMYDAFGEAIIINFNKAE